MLAHTTRVLQTPELFELILLQLPLRTLLTTAQLVNRQWHDFIVSSPALQRALFLQPCPPGTERRINPILAEDFSIFFDESLHQQEDFESLPFAIQRRKLPFGRKAPEDRVTHDKFFRPDASWRRMLPQQPPVLKVGFWTYQTTWGCRSRGEFKTRYVRSAEPERATANPEPASVEGQAVDQPVSRQGWTMGMIYDEGVRSAWFFEGPWRIFWDIEWNLANDKPDTQYYRGTRRYDPGPDVCIGEAEVDVYEKGPGMEWEDPEDVAEYRESLLKDCLDGASVIFQHVYRQSCVRSTRHRLLEPPATVTFREDFSFFTETPADSNQWGSDD